MNDDLAPVRNIIQGPTHKNICQRDLHNLVVSAAYHNINMIYHVMISTTTSDVYEIRSPKRFTHLEAVIDLKNDGCFRMKSDSPYCHWNLIKYPI